MTLTLTDKEVEEYWRLKALAEEARNVINTWHSTKSDPGAAAQYLPSALGAMQNALIKAESATKN